MLDQLSKITPTQHHVRTIPMVPPSACPVIFDWPRECPPNFTLQSIGTPCYNFFFVSAFLHARARVRAQFRIPSVHPNIGLCGCMVNLCRGLFFCPVFFFGPVFVPAMPASAVRVGKHAEQSFTAVYVTNKMLLNHR